MTRQLILLLFFINILNVNSQDFQYGQFYALPLYYNPAFAGANLNSRLTAGYRNQWSGLQGWKGWVGSFDWYIKNANSGVGIFLSSNKIDRLGYGHTTGMLQYAYRTKLNKNVRISAGLGLGFGQVSWSFGNKIFGDQLAGDPIRPTSTDPVAALNISDYYLDIQLGILVYSKKWWTSVSVLHPNSPSFDILGQNQIDPRVNVSAGYRFEMKKPIDYKGEISPNAITPAILLRNQGGASQVDLGVYLHYVPFVFGLWYRGIPTPVKESKNLNNDALSVLVGIKQNNLSIGYSYDINISGLVGVFGGSHEITVTYEFNTKYLSLKGLSPGKALPCPSF